MKRLLRREMEFSVFWLSDRTPARDVKKNNCGAISEDLSPDNDNSPVYDSMRNIGHSNDRTLNAGVGNGRVNV